MLVKEDVLPPILLLLESPNAVHKIMRQLCEQTLDIVQQFLSEVKEENHEILSSNDLQEFLKSDIKCFYKSNDLEFLVLNNDKVLVSGMDDHGKLGLGYVKECLKYTEIPELSDKKIECFFNGNDCMFAKSEINEIYSWGMNYWGQLGRGHESGMFDYLKPGKIDFFDDKNIIEITINFDHCLAISSNGNVYGWGYNNQGQIVPGSNENQILIPIAIKNKLLKDDIFH